MAEPDATEDVFEDPIIDEPEPEITPPSESASLPDDEGAPEPLSLESEDPPAQAAAPQPPVEPLPSTPVETVPEAVPTPPVYEPPPAPTIQFYSREQLQRAVDDGVISANQMADQLQLQLKEEIKQETAREFREQQRTQALVTKIQGYHTLVPGWNKPGTQAHTRANAEYQKLLNLGLTANPVTELLALEKAFGTVDHIKAQRASADLTRQSRDTVPTVARRGTPPASSKSVDPLKQMDREELKLYDKYIKAGHYRDWNAVREEIRWAATQTINKDLKSNTERLMRR